jgi:hypothetical protein
MGRAVAAVAVAAYGTVATTAPRTAASTAAEAATLAATLAAAVRAWAARFSIETYAVRPIARQLTARIESHPAGSGLTQGESLGPRARVDQKSRWSAAFVFNLADSAAFFVFSSTKTGDALGVRNWKKVSKPHPTWV